MTIYARTSIQCPPPLPVEAEAQLASTGCAGELRSAKARKEVFAVRTRVESVSRKWVAVEDAKWGTQLQGRSPAFGTGMGLGGMKGRSAGGSSCRLAARTTVAVVKVIAQHSDTEEQFVVAAV